MFRAKAKTTSVKIKDINKYIGRVWTVISDVDAKRSKDLLLNKNKLFIETDILDLKKKFGLPIKSNSNKKSNSILEIEEQNKIFTVRPTEVEEEKSKIKVWTPDSNSEIKLNLMDDVEDVKTEDIKVESTVIEDNIPEPFVPEVGEKILNNLINTDDNSENEEFTAEEIQELKNVLDTYESDEIEEVEEPIELNKEIESEPIKEELEPIEANLNEETELKEEENNKYKVSPKRRGRKKKSEEN